MIIITQFILLRNHGLIRVISLFYAHKILKVLEMCILYCRNKLVICALPETPVTKNKCLIIFIKIVLSLLSVFAVIAHLNVVLHMGTHALNKFFNEMYHEYFYSARTVVKHEFLD
jgi:hypothetical protein